MHVPEFGLGRVLRASAPQPPPEGTARLLLYLEACGTSERSERLTRCRCRPALGFGRKRMASIAWDVNDGRRMSSSVRQAASFRQAGRARKAGRRGAVLAPQCAEAGCLAGRIGGRSGVRGGLSFRGRCRRRGWSPSGGVCRTSHPVPRSARWRAGCLLRGSRGLPGVPDDRFAAFAGPGYILGQEAHRGLAVEQGQLSRQRVIGPQGQLLRFHHHPSWPLPHQSGSPCEVARA